MLNLTTLSLSDLCVEVRKAVLIAGQAILEISQSRSDPHLLNVQTKSDSSPVTQADLISHSLLIESLRALAPYPIISEEDEAGWKADLEDYFWLIDPLDGTRHFIAGDGEYAVCVALMFEARPVLGVVYAPEKKEMYSAVEGAGAERNGHQIYNRRDTTELTAYSSGYHEKPRGHKFMAAMGIRHIIQLGSALKLARLAAGEADIYPRFGQTYEWDTAAAQIILQEAGCELLDLKTLAPLTYRKPGWLNDGFIAARRGLSISKRYFQ
jgi:3'(2'), 5'-bisphosphate nucleotidase